MVREFLDTNSRGDKAAGKGSYFCSEQALFEDLYPSCVPRIILYDQKDLCQKKLRGTAQIIL